MTLTSMSLQVKTQCRCGLALVHWQGQKTMWYLCPEFLKGRPVRETRQKHDALTVAEPMLQ